MDFEGYVAAHWARLVRSAVLMGCPSSDAEDLVQTALTKALRSWSRVQAAEQPHVVVGRLDRILEEHGDQQSGPGGGLEDRGGREKAAGEREGWLHRVRILRAGRRAGPPFCPARRRGCRRGRVR